MLDMIGQVVKSRSKDDSFRDNITFYMGRAQATNGYLIVDEPFIEFESSMINVDGSAFLKIYNALGDKRKIQEKSKNLIVSDADTTFKVRRKAEESSMMKQISGDRYSMPEKLVDAIKIVQPFMGREDYKLYTSLVAIIGDYIYACAYGYLVRVNLEGDFKLPEPYNLIPAYGADFLINNPEPVNLFIDQEGNWITFEYDNTAWISIRSMETELPDFEGIFADQAQLFENLDLIPETLPGSLSKMMHVYSMIEPKYLTMNGHDMFTPPGEHVESHCHLEPVEGFGNYNAKIFKQLLDISTRFNVSDSDQTALFSNEQTGMQAVFMSMGV